MTEDIRIAITSVEFFEVWTWLPNNILRGTKILSESVDVDDIPFEVEGLIRHINRVCKEKEKR